MTFVMDRVTGVDRLVENIPAFLYQACMNIRTQHTDHNGHNYERHYSFFFESYPCYLWGIANKSSTNIGSLPDRIFTRVMAEPSES